MTMQHESHPHDERLAGLAGADPEATDDRALRDHVASCDRCRAVVDDLALLRSALAELPDLRPSRPLQLLPPVAEPRQTGGALGLLRRLSAPALAAGAVLILVGAVGSSGVLEGLSGLGAAGAAPAFGNVGENLMPAAEDSSTDEATRASDTANPDLGGTPAALGASPGGTARQYLEGTASPSQSEVPSSTSLLDGDDDARDLGTLSTSTDPFDGRLPWLLTLGAGIALAVAALVLRFTVQPRAG